MAILAWQGAVPDRRCSSIAALCCAVTSTLPWAIAALTAIVAWLRPLKFDRVAKLVDRQCQLRDRMSTAWYFAMQAKTTGASCLADHTRQPATLQPFRELQIADALTHLRHVDASQVVPWRWSRLWFWGAALWMLTWALHVGVTAA